MPGTAKKVYRVRRNWHTGETTAVDYDILPDPPLPPPIRWEPGDDEVPLCDCGGTCKACKLFMRGEHR